MSASLVGSEMCIRDSLGGELVGEEDASRAFSTSSLVAPWPARAPGEECCLLYTSDAADDM
eukprot:8423459-Alexandrium_andersonii.AAC.1